MTDHNLHNHSDPHPGGYRNVSPALALRHLPEVRKIDVREPDEYVGPLGHIEGAELVPLATVAVAAADWDRQMPILLICRSGGRSGRAASTLAAMGFTQLYNLDGGMLAWDANGLPRSQQAPAPARS